MVRLLENFPNLYADISAGSGFNALTRDPDFGFRFLECFQDRLLFGTDFCSPENKLLHASFLRKSLADGRIPREAFEKIAWKNAVGILDLRDIVSDTAARS